MEGTITKQRQSWLPRDISGFQERDENRAAGCGVDNLYYREDN